MDQNALNQLLSVGVQSGASDIHLRPGDPPIYRINGQIVPMKMEKLRAEHTQQICQVLIRDEVAKAQLDVVHEYDTSYSVPGVARFRANIYRQRGSLAVVLRIIPAQVPTLQAMGMPPVIATLATQERGLVLVTGATGSGKSSTLAAMVDHINRTDAVHILTIEDPIEFLHPHKNCIVNQREVGADTDSFKKALKYVLRQDPDVGLVGEMRDTETIDIALKAAETGHLVLSSVHTVDAANTIGRLVSVFIPEEQAMVRLRLPCSQLRIVSSDTSIRSANSCCVSPNRFRTRCANRAASCAADASSTFCCKARSASDVSASLRAFTRPAGAFRTDVSSILKCAVFIVPCLTDIGLASRNDANGSATHRKHDME